MDCGRNCAAHRSASLRLTRLDRRITMGRAIGVIGLAEWRNVP